MKWVIAAIVCLALLLTLLSGTVTIGASTQQAFRPGCTSAIHQAGSDIGTDPESPPFSLEDVPEYEGDPSAIVNDGVPFFTDDDRRRGSFEQYSQLDRRGRCGTAFALISPETLPTAKREGIGMIKPSGWQIARYPWVDGEYLYNRCHLIGFQLAGENANPLNLITGTRSLNILGMLPYEDEVASYVRWTGNHVLYRVTPLFEGKNLVASGVLIEAESVEDDGWGVQFCVWCYNVEPGVAIDYATGASRADGTISLQ